MNFYPLHIGDYAAHTRNLSLLEDLAYRRLLDAYYLAEHPFNGSSTDVAREIGMRDQVAEVEYVLCKFFEREGDSWRNKRADTEIAKYREKLEKASRAGKASAERRSNARSTSVAVESNVRSTSVDKKPNGRATNHEPRTNNQIDTPLPPSSGGADVVLPEWFPMPEWGEFVAMRKAKGKRAPFTEAAAKGIVEEVTKLRANGHDPAQVLRQSVMNGWSGVFGINPGGANGATRKTGNSDDAHPAWATRAGFPNRWEAESARCYEHNASQFRDGKRIAEAA